jgi:hypothetical protein
MLKKVGTTSIDNNTINKLTGKLNAILQLELKAGNRIVETYEGDWPYPNSIMIFLEKPFKTPILRDLEDITFNNVNDPHYWKAEYADLKNRMWLCCRFDGSNFEPL